MSYYVLMVRDSFGLVEAVEANEKSVAGEMQTLRENYSRAEGYRIVKLAFETVEEMTAHYNKVTK